MTATPQRHRSGIAEWVAGAADARAVYDLIVAVVSGVPVAEPVADRAARVRTAVWEHVLELEGCAAWLEHESRRAVSISRLLTPAAAYIRAESTRSLRNAVAMVQQISEIASLAVELGARVLVLKGGARLLAGEPAGARTMADIDLLTNEADAPALHAALQARLGYLPEEPGTPVRHLPSLIRAGSLPVEIHLRLSDEGSSLDRRVWQGMRSVQLGQATVDIPGATPLMLHAIEHAVVVHRAARYRLRDVIDVATAWTEDVDAGELVEFTTRHSQREAMQTLVTAASRLARSASASNPAWLTRSGPTGAAWRRVRRVGRARLWAPPRPGIPPASDPRVFVLSQLAEGSPGPLIRLAARAIRAPQRAWRLASGTWLPVEALQARDAHLAMSSPDPLPEPPAPPAARR
jgi:hypothetical protein